MNGKFKKNGVERYIDSDDGMLHEPDGRRVPNNEDEYYQELAKYMEKMKPAKKAA